MAKRRSGRTARVARPGYAMVSVSARDANGFVHHYDDIEASLDSLREAIAVLQRTSARDDAAPRHGTGPWPDTRRFPVDPGRRGTFAVVRQALWRLRRA